MCSPLEIYLGNLDLLEENMGYISENIYLTLSSENRI